MFHRLSALVLVLLVAGLGALHQASSQTLLLLGAGKGAVSAGAASVTPDVIGTSAFQTTSNNFNKTPLTITGGLTNSALVCTLLRAAALDVSTGVAITWNGVAMALRASQLNGPATQGAFIFGLRNPTSGSQTLNVSATNIASDNFVNCVSFSNVNQTSDVLAFPNPTGTTGAASIAVASASGHISIGAFTNAASNGTILGTTIINDAVSGAAINCGADYVVSSGASTTVGTSASQATIAGMDVSN